jgi:hypothetical protein
MAVELGERRRDGLGTDRRGRTGDGYGSGGWSWESLAPTRRTTLRRRQAMSDGATSAVRRTSGDGCQVRSGYRARRVPTWPGCSDCRYASQRLRREIATALAQQPHGCGTRSDDGQDFAPRSLRPTPGRAGRDPRGAAGATCKLAGLRLPAEHDLAAGQRATCRVHRRLDRRRVVPPQALNEWVPPRRVRGRWCPGPHQRRRLERQNARETTVARTQVDPRPATDRTSRTAFTLSKWRWVR